MSVHQVWTDSNWRHLVHFEQQWPLPVHLVLFGQGARATRVVNPRYNNTSLGNCGGEQIQMCQCTTSVLLNLLITSPGPSPSANPFGAEDARNRRRASQGQEPSLKAWPVPSGQVPYPAEGQSLLLEKQVKAPSASHQNATHQCEMFWRRLDKRSLFGAKKKPPAN